MANVYDIAMSFRASLLRQENSAARTMVAQYGMIYLRLKTQLQEFLTAVEAEKKANPGSFDPGWVYRERRIDALILQTEAEVNRFSSYLTTQITDQQRSAVGQAQEDVPKAIASAFPPKIKPAFNRLPSEALSDLVGFLQDGSPLKSLLDQLGTDASASVKESLISGLASGQNPRGIARDVRASMGMTLTRALMISRTETLRSYRTATLRNYHANDDVVRQWAWCCAQDGRTCATCLAMDGQKFDTDVMMGTHPNCRCVLTPVTKSWAQMGYSGIDEQPEREDGEAWLRKQDAQVQTRVLGIAKRAAWLDGKITLQDLVKYKDDPQWGPQRTENSLADALQAANAR